MQLPHSLDSSHRVVTASASSGRPPAKPDVEHTCPADDVAAATIDIGLIVKVPGAAGVREQAGDLFLPLVVAEGHSEDGPCGRWERTGAGRQSHRVSALPEAVPRRVARNSW